MFGINLHRLEKHHLRLNKSQSNQNNCQSLIDYNIPVVNIFNLQSSLSNNYLNDYVLKRYLSILTKN